MRTKRTFKEEEMIQRELNKYKRKCTCGHTIIFYNNSRRDKLICTHCGRYIYKSDLTEFKEKLGKLKKD